MLVVRPDSSRASKLLAYPVEVHKQISSESLSMQHAESRGIYIADDFSQHSN